MAQRMVSYVNDWSSVKLALDIGCGRGIFLNAVATQLKKTQSSGRVIENQLSSPFCSSHFDTRVADTKSAHCSCSSTPPGPVNWFSGFNFL
uniref:Uncharacterized protein n=1 Tax=Manihot esculenta TaxID=3983 RepID=A0A2C9UUB4_MANES